MSRRDLLQRGALLGGAVLAAQSLGRVSAFAQTSPEPPPPPPPEPSGTLPSNFQIILGFGGVNYGVKYDGSWGSIGRGVVCDFQTPYSDPTSALIAALAGHVSVGTDEAGHLAYILDLPSGVTFVEGRPFDGTCQATPGGDKCGAPVQVLSDGTLAFTACD